MEEDQSCIAVFDEFLHFFYTRKVELTAENALPILTLADKYGVTELQKV